MSPLPASSPIPIIENSEQRLAKMRSRLEGIFQELHTIQAVIVVSAEIIENQGADFDPEVSCVLTRCASNRLHNQLQSLTFVIEQLGGRTEYTDIRERSPVGGPLLTTSRLTGQCPRRLWRSIRWCLG
jgi:hypothetical protein